MAKQIYLDKQEQIKDIKYEIQQQHKVISQANNKIAELTKQLMELQST